jgi:hypothetical protein
MVGSIAAGCNGTSSLAAASGIAAMLVTADFPPEGRGDLDAGNRGACMITAGSAGRFSAVEIAGPFGVLCGFSEGGVTLSIRFSDAWGASIWFGAWGIALSGSAGGIALSGSDGASRRVSAALSNIGFVETGCAACIGGISSASGKESPACHAALITGTRATGTAGATDTGGRSAIPVRAAAAITRCR